MGGTAGDDYSNPCQDNDLDHYLSLPQVRKALNVYDVVGDKKWNGCNDALNAGWNQCAFPESLHLVWQRISNKINYRGKAFESGGWGDGREKRLRNVSGKGHERCCGGTMCAIKFEGILVSNGATFVARGKLCNVYMRMLVCVPVGAGTVYVFMFKRNVCGCTETLLRMSVFGGRGTENVD